jgi:hypothetical protein
MRLVRWQLENWIVDASKQFLLLAVYFDRALYRVRVDRLMIN